MDTTTSWLKIACLLVIAGILIGILAWAWKCLKAAIKDIKEAAALEINAEKKTWVAEVMLPNDESKSPCYMFHCTQDAEISPGVVTKGKHYLYSGRGFVTTDNPGTAILLQQLLNDGQLTVKTFNPDTNDLSK
jgi:hypothetical protein